MEPVKITLAIDPVAKGRPRIGRSGIAYTPTKTRTFESNLKSLLRKEYSGEMATDAVSVSVTFNIPRPKSVKRPHPCVRPDIDNFLKAILDASNGILWEDDALICELTTEKKYAKEGSIQIQVWPINHGYPED